MTWFKIDDGFYDHPKFLDLPNGAVGLWAKAGAWCGKHLTDGLIPATKVKALKGTASQIHALIDAELWDEAVTDAGTKAYRFHDWTDFQPTREQKLQERADSAERQQKSRERRQGDSKLDSDRLRNESGMDPKSHSNRTRFDPEGEPNPHADRTKSEPKSRKRKGRDQEQHENVTRDSHVTPLRDKRVSHTQVSQRPDPTRPDPTPLSTGSQSPYGEQPRAPTHATHDPEDRAPALTHDDGTPTPTGIIREWERASGSPLTDSTRTAMRLAVSQCLRAGHHPNTIAQGLADWAASKITATSQIPSFIDRAAVKPRLAATTNHQHNADGWLALGEQLAAEETR